MCKSEYQANKELDTAAVKYSAEWMKPSNGIYQRTKRGWFVRLIAWLVAG